MKIVEELPPITRISQYREWADGLVRLFELDEVGGDVERFRTRLGSASQHLRNKGRHGHFSTRARPEGLYVQWIEAEA